MSTLDPAAVTTRTLTIVLPESEWHALRTVEPDAIGWLRGRIRERLGSEGREPSRPSESSSSTTAPRWSTDEY